MRIRDAALALLITAAVPAQLLAAQSITVTGSWSLPVDATDLAGGAGTDLDPAIESASDEASLDISGTTGSSDAWRVEAHLSGGQLPPGAGLVVQRTSAGSGPGSISGGTTYTSLSATPVELFNGTGDRTGVQLQLRLNGLSVSAGADIWSIAVVYTIVDE